MQFCFFSGKPPFLSELFSKIFLIFFSSSFFSWLNEFKMPSGYRYRRSYYGRYSRYRRAYRGLYARRYRRRYGYSRRFANGSSTSSVRIKVPVNDIYLKTGPSTGDVNTIAPFVTACPFQNCGPTFASRAAPSSAVGSPIYQRYTALYDEVKCIGVKARIAILTPIGGAEVPALEVVTAWDRRLQGKDLDSAYAPSFDELKTYPTQKTYLAVNNSVSKFTRSCYAHDLIEKAQWHDSSYTQTTTTSIVDDTWNGNPTNINFFCPGLWIAFRCPSITTQLSIRYSCDITYYFSFRNPKYGASAQASSSKSIEAPVMRASAPELEVEDLDLAEDEDVQADIIAQELAAKRASVKVSKTATKIVTPKK